MKLVVLYVGHLYKLFWTKKIWPGWQGGSKKVKIWPRMGLAFIYFWPRSLLEAPKWVKDPGNGLKSIRGSWGDHCQPGQFFWSKMACTCVPHIVLHVSCRTRTSGGYFRPSEVRFRAKIPLSSHWFYNVKTQKTRFLKKGPIKLADFLYIHSLWCPQPPCQILQMALSRVGLVV